MAGPLPECVDAPALDEAGEVDLAKLPAWMRGLPEPFGRLRAGSGPPTAEEAQADLGAAQDNTDELPPDW